MLWISDHSNYTLLITHYKNEKFKLPEIKNVHHVHIWQLNEDEIHLEAHIDFNNDITLSEFDTILQEIEVLLYNKYHINHVNIQPEYNKEDVKDVIVQD